MRIGVSAVDGRGLITNDSIDKGDEIGVMGVAGKTEEQLVKDGELTEIGQNVNHSKVSNAQVEKKGNKLVLVASQKIDENEEVFIDYEMNPVGFSTDIRGFQ